VNPKFKYLVKLFQKLPGVGPRQGARFVLSLFNRTDAELQELGDAIANLRQSIRFCKQCFNVADDAECHICQSTNRERSKILVVEKITDLDSFEKTGLYKGLYHVLGGAINPVDGVNPENLRLKELHQRVITAVKNGLEPEVILATNVNTAGETTALYIREMFGDLTAQASTQGITVTRLARGLASGSNLEYADELTLKNALDFRK
jgi:recombination protein RecR